MQKPWMKYSVKWHHRLRELNNMSIITSLIKKETLHVLRDTRTVVITLFMPLALLLLFGFAISTEVNKVKLVAVTENFTDEIRNILQEFQINEYFDFMGLVGSYEVEEMLRAGETDAAVYLKTDKGNLSSQIIVDASNTTTAQTATVYIQNILNRQQVSSNVLIRTLYNPQLKSSYNFVPGILGMIFILICAIMTSVSIVGEKENGTMSLLLVSPIKPKTIIFGKLVPYFLLSCIILGIMLAISYTVLGIPFSSSVLNVIWVSLLYVVLSLSIGLLVSTIVNTQLTALIVSAIAFMLPVIMLSGMIFPIDNMPAVLQWISCIIPARWYIDAMRRLMIQQLELWMIWEDIVILAGITILIMVIAVKNFNKRK